MQEILNVHYKGKGLSENKFVDEKQYINCSFEKCNLSGYTFTNCDFTDCTFLNCNFTNSFLAQNIKYNSGQFIRCQFVACNMKATSFRFPVIVGCEFRNCRLDETNFDGSRFSDTLFTGELDSCFFRGYSIYAKSGSVFSFGKFDPSTKPNTMDRVDFSRARLVGNAFTNAIDLSKCIFPGGEDYIYIKDLKTTMQGVLNSIQLTWPEGGEKNMAIKLINGMYYNNDMQNQPNAFIDAFIPKEMDDREGGNLSMRLFGLIQSFK